MSYAFVLPPQSYDLWQVSRVSPCHEASGFMSLCLYLSLCMLKWHYARSYCGSQSKNMWGLVQQPGGGTKEDTTCHQKIQLHCYGEWGWPPWADFCCTWLAAVCLLAGHGVSRGGSQTHWRVQKQRWLSVPTTALQCWFAEDNPAGPHIYERTRGIPSGNINVAVQF